MNSGPDLNPVAPGASRSGMHVTVVPLRASGMKQRGEVLEGYLIVSDADIMTMEFRARSQARLHLSTDISKGTLCPPLFDPVVLQWDGRGIFLQGWQIECDESMALSQVVQVWCVRPVPGC